MKIQKKIFFFWGGGVGGEVGMGVGGGGVGLGGGQGGCERRTEVFVKIQKKNFFFFWGGGWVGGGGGVVRVDVNQELKFFGKFKKKIWGGGSGLGGQDGCQRRIEVFVKIKKKNFFLGGGGGGGGLVGGSGWM